MKRNKKGLDASKPLLILAGCVVFTLLFAAPCRAKNISDLPVDKELSGILSVTDSIPIEKRDDILTDLLKDYVSTHAADPLGRYFLAKKYIDAFHYKEAVEQLGFAIAYEPEFADAHALSAYALSLSWDLESGRTATGTLAVAKAAIEKAIQLAPERSDFYSTAASVYNNMGDTAAAISALKKAAWIDPAEVKNYYNLGLLSNQVGKCFTAQRYFNDALILSSDKNNAAMMPRDDLYDILGAPFAEVNNKMYQSKSRFDKGVKFVSEGKYEAAIPDFEEALSICADNSKAMTELGKIYDKQQKDNEKAYSYYKDAADSDPLNTEALFGKCTLLPAVETSENNASLADECWSSLSALKGFADICKNYMYGEDKADQLLIIGVGFMKMKRREEAAPYLAAASLLSPENSAAADALKCALNPECNL